MKDTIKSLFAIQNISAFLAVFATVAAAVSSYYAYKSFDQYNLQNSAYLMPEFKIIEVDSTNAVNLHYEIRNISVRPAFNVKGALVSMPVTKVRNNDRILRIPSHEELKVRQISISDRSILKTTGFTPFMYTPEGRFLYIAILLRWRDGENGRYIDEKYYRYFNSKYKKENIEPFGIPMVEEKERIWGKINLDSIFVNNTSSNDN